VTALLELLDARVDVGGAPALDGLGLRTTGERVLVLGAARALFDAASGVSRLVRGEALVRGRPALAALRAGEVAGAPLDPPLPSAWTPRAYVAWSARLAGRDRATARALADDACERLGMEALADAPLGRLAQDKPAPGAQGLVPRRATVIAAAMATGAPALMLEDPMNGLPDAAARRFGRLLVRALEERAWALFAPRAVLATPLALAAEEAIAISGSRVVAQGDPAEVAGRERTYAITVHGAIEELARAAEARGAKVERAPAQLTVDLGDALGTRDLLQMALDVRAVIVELAPISRTLG
jgi:ABC-type multidrug transport system ATPase subunit